MSHISFKIVTPSNPHSKKRIEKIQDAVCAAKKAGHGARIVSENSNNPSRVMSDNDNGYSFEEIADGIETGRYDD